jgi:hypothetical protein
MIAPAFCMWRFAIWAPLKAPFDHPQSSLNPQGTVVPPGGPLAVAPAGASRIAKTLATAASDASEPRLTSRSSHNQGTRVVTPSTDPAAGENTYPWKLGTLEISANVSKFRIPVAVPPGFPAIGDRLTPEGLR